MKITSGTVYQHMKHRYPNAKIYVLDTEYELAEESVFKGHYDKFQRSLWKYKIRKWLSNVFDCDDFAWHFKGWCGIQGRLKGRSAQLPVGFLCYHIEGDKSRGHAINNAIWIHDKGSILREIEPQSGGGVKSLSKEERESAWLVVV